MDAAKSRFLMARKKNSMVELSHQNEKQVTC